MQSHRERSEPWEVVVRLGWRLRVWVMLRLLLAGQLHSLVMSTIFTGMMMASVVIVPGKVVGLDDFFRYWQVVSLVWLVGVPLIGWWMHKRGVARLGRLGIRPEGMHGAKGWFRYWSKLSWGASIRINWDEIVGVGASRFRGWLRVLTRCEREFALPELSRASDPEEYLEAVERFAGVGHPLAVALRASW